MIGNLGMLKYICPYFGNDSVIIRNGSLLGIKSIGDASIKRSNQILPLKNVLQALNLNRNLLFISQLMDYYRINCEYFNVDFCVEKRETGHKMMT